MSDDSEAGVVTASGSPLPPDPAFDAAVRTAVAARGIPTLYIRAETGVAQVIVTDDGTPDGRVVQEHLLGPGVQQWITERSATITPD